MLNSNTVERREHTQSLTIMLLSDYDYRIHEIRNDHLIEITGKRLLVDKDVVVTLAVGEAVVSQLP